jgi:hypothetical protein
MKKRVLLERNRTNQKTEKTITVSQKHLLFPLRLLNDTKLNALTSSSIPAVHLFFLPIVTHLSSIICPCKIKEKKEDKDHLSSRIYVALICISVIHYSIE